MKEIKNRRLKVYGQSNGYNYQDVPTIVLKGKWLENAGFSIEDQIQVIVEYGKILVQKVEAVEGLYSAVYQNDISGGKHLYECE